MDSVSAFGVDHGYISKGILPARTGSKFFGFAGKPKVPQSSGLTDGRSKLLDMRTKLGTTLHDNRVSNITDGKPQVGLTPKGQNLTTLTNPMNARRAKKGEIPNASSLKNRKQQVVERRGEMFAPDAPPLKPL